MKHIVIFGAGANLNKILHYINHRKVNVIRVVDNNSKRWGEKVGRILIDNPNVLKKIKYDAVIISSSSYYDEIKNQLLDMKVRNIIPAYSTNMTEREQKLAKYCFNSFGLLALWYAKKRKEQEFYPSYLGIGTNPYYFARKGLLKSIESNKAYITGKCLDFGCGIKPYQKLFNTTEYVGVEIEAENKKADIVYYDGKTIPFEDETFDCIMCSQFFEHIPNLQEIAKELNRVLKKDGYILLTIPFIYPEHLQPYDFRRFTSFGINSFMNDNGFSVIKVEKSGNYIQTITQMKNVYFNEKLFEKQKNPMMIIKKFLIFITNFTGLITDKLCIESDALYLDNIVVAQKK